VLTAVDTLAQRLRRYALASPGLPSRCGTRIGMSWLRTNIRHGSRLALLALAVQFVLSFGHFHAIAAQASPFLQAQAALTQSSSTPDQEQQRPTEPCAICAVMALANAALSGSPPVLLLPQAVEFLYLITDAEFVHLDHSRLAFQPRAPPAS
jgi:hypothetical protein